MKYKVLIVFIVLSISCEKFLYEEDDKIGNIENQKEFEEAIAGINSILSDVYSYHYFLHACVLADDISLKPGSYGNCTYGGLDFYNISIVGSNIYKNLYKTIISTNNLIMQADNTQNITQANTYIGEAYFIRSICYFYLTRFFGDIPIITDLDVKYDTKRSGISEIYKLIEADMLMAIQLLPSSNKTARIPYTSPHRGSAKAVLAEIYLNMAGFPLKDTEKYKLAAKYAGEVIDSSEFFDMALLDDFARLWHIDYFNNTEKIFGCNFDKSLLGSESRYTVDRSIDSIEIYVPQVRLWYQYGIIPEFNFYKSYPSNYRKKVSFYMGYYIKESYSIEDEDYEWLKYVEINPFDYCDFMQYTSYRKWLLNGNHKITALYLFRYAHTLLTYAEAKAKSNQLDESAYEAVNKVKRRANKLDINQSSGFDLQPGLSSDQFADSVIRERAFEFCAEPEGRWFDILRLERFEEIHETKYYREPEVPWYSAIPEENYFMDFPQEDIWLNPNLENPAN